MALIPCDFIWSLNNLEIGAKLSLSTKVRHRYWYNKSILSRLYNQVSSLFSINGCKLCNFKVGFLGPKNLKCHCFEMTTNAGFYSFIQ